MKYLIVLNGCDDTTYCELELNDNEIEFLIKISKEINKHSGYQCQPTISIYKDYKVDDGRYILYNGDYDFKKNCYELEATDLTEVNNE